MFLLCFFVDIHWQRNLQCLDSFFKDSDKCFFQHKPLASGNNFPCLFWKKIGPNLFYGSGQNFIQCEGAKTTIVAENVESLGVIMWQGALAFSESGANGTQQLSSSCKKKSNFMILYNTVATFL